MATIDVNTLVFEPVEEGGASAHARIAERLQQKLQALTVEREIVGLALDPIATDPPGEEGSASHLKGVALTRQTDEAREISVESRVDTTEEADRDAVEERLEAGWSLISWNRTPGEGTSLLVFQRPRMTS